MSSSNSRAAYTLSTSSISIDDQAAHRVAIACLACRSAKRKCSGRQPCELCIAKRRPCVYLSRAPIGQGRSQSGVEVINMPSLAHDDDLSACEDIFLGSPAALVFFELLQRTMLGAELDDGLEEDLRPAFADNTPYLSDAELTTVPNREEAGELLEMYVQTAWRHNPLMHVATLRTEWQHMFDSLATGVRPSLLSLALINIICALGALFSENADGDNSQADSYADRCAALMALEARRAGLPSLLLIQVLSHQTIYSYYRLPIILRDVSMTLERAISVAIQIGLHLEPNAARHNAVSKECRRRTWWCLYNFSMMNACMLGRPPTAAAAKGTCALPSALPDEVNSIAITFLISKARLSQLVGAILESLYFANAKPLSSKELGLMMDMEGQLEDWRESMPPEMRIERAAWLTEEAQIMRLIFEHCRLLLMRRALVRLLTPEAAAAEARRQTDITKSAWSAAEAACYKAAQALIDAAHACQDNVLYRHSCFYHADFLFVGIAVLLAARWRGQIENFNQSFERAIDAIKGPLPRIAERLISLARHLASSNHEPAASQDLLNSMLQQIWGQMVDGDHTHLGM